MSSKTESRYALLLTVSTVAIGMLIVTGMFTYPIPYSWARHFLSAMGLTRLPDGTTNYLTATIFNSALILAGILCAGYFCIRGSRSGRRILTVPLWCAGIVGGGALAGIGLVPYNLGPDLHNYCTYFASAGLGAGIVLCAWSKENSMGSASDNILWVVMALFVGAIWVALQDLREEHLLPGTPTGQLQQKIMVGFFWLYMLWNSLKFYLTTRTPQCMAVAEEESDRS